MVSKTTGSFVPFSTERAAEVVEKHRAERGPLMPILHELQDIFGYIDADALDVLASALNVSKAEVYGVVTFYKDFHDEPPGSSVVSHLPGRGLSVDGR